MPKAETVQDAVMDVSMMKTILRSVGNTPVESGGARLPICVAIDDADEAMVMVAKRGKGKKLRSDALKAIKKEGVEDKIDLQPTKFYFGYAFTSTSMPGALIMSVNKKPLSEGKLTKAIKKRVRSAGFSDVVIQVNDALENEPEDENVSGQTDASIPPPPPPPVEAPLDAAALKKRLGTLMVRAGSVGKQDQGYRSTLFGFAQDANTALKDNAIEQAAGLIEQLEAALNNPPVTADIPAEGGQEFSFVKLQKMRLIWQSVRTKVQAEVDGLKKEITVQFAGDPDEEEVLEALDDLDDIPIELDDRLLDALDDLMTGDLPPADREKLVQRAQAIVTDYENFAQSNQILQKLQGNTAFGALSAASTVGTALKALRQSIA